MECIRLERPNHARSLADLVYSTYGLTFHRDWLYDAEKMLELNRRSDIVSFVAVEGDHVVGHLALIRPMFDQVSANGPVCSPHIRECGLSIVHPDARGGGVQAALAMAMMSWGVENGVPGALMRCVTHHTWSQRSALAMGGTPIAMLLGSIPRWVSYDHDDPSQREPLSTLIAWVPGNTNGATTHTLLRPAELSWIDESVQMTGVIRTSASLSPTLPAETRLHTTWCGARRLAQVHVQGVGQDLVQRLSDTCRWLIGGHIAHISLFLPADEPFVMEVHAELVRLGLFPAGWIPGYLAGDRDALVYQSLAWTDLNPDRIEVVGARASVIRSAVVRAWESVRANAAGPGRNESVPRLQQTA